MIIKWIHITSPIQQILPVPGVFGGRPNFRFRALVTHLYFLSTGPRECIIEPEQNESLNLTVDVNAVHQKKVEDQ